MLRLTSKKTLPILLYALDSPSFTQSEIRDNTGISIGRVNSIMKHLLDLGIAIKENARYRILQPNRLCELIAAGIVIKEYQTFYVEADKKAIQRIVKETGARLCLESSLERHIKGFQADAVNIVEDEKMIKALQAIARGSMKVVIFKKHLETEIDPKYDRIMTVIELSAAGKREKAALIAEKIWQTRQ